jgi:ATP-dependent DNA helicase HFM1/MER3
VIDCKVHDQDSVMTKTAMELSRSLAATAWEGRPPQLMQIPTVGPVSMRRLIVAGIRTVKELVTKDYGELERLLGAKPPAGKKLADSLANFPLLSMDLARVTAPQKTADVGGKRMVQVKATLRCLNKAAPLLWGEKATPILATFLAETTSGLLVHFWRGTLNQIQAPKPVELKFTAEIEAVEDQIQCYVTCDEIVGTIVSKTLAHNIPASMFPVKEPSPDLELLSRSPVNDVVEDDLDDEDMLEAAAMADTVVVRPRPHNSAPRKVQAEAQDESDYDSAEFPAIEDIQDLIVVAPPLRPLPATAKPRPTPRKTAAASMSAPHTQNPTSTQTAAASTSSVSSKTSAIATVAIRSAQSIPKVSKTKATGVSSATAWNPVTPHQEVDREPVQLPNGRWQCNHACTGGNLTKGGKQCSHKCCLEGLDKPRKLKSKMSKTDEAKAPGKKRKVEDHQEDTDFASSIARETVSGPSSTLPGKKAKISPQALTDEPGSDSFALNRFTIGNPTNNPSFAGKYDANFSDLDEDPIDLVGDAGDDDDLPDMATLSARIKEKGKGKMKAHDSTQKGEKPTNTQVAPAVGEKVNGQSSETEAGLQRSPDSDSSEFANYFNTSDVVPYHQGQSLEEKSPPVRGLRSGTRDTMPWNAQSSFHPAEGTAFQHNPEPLGSETNRPLQEAPQPSAYRMGSSWEGQLHKAPGLLNRYGMEGHGYGSNHESSDLSHEAHYDHQQPREQSSPFTAAALSSGLVNEAEPQEAVAREPVADPDWLDSFDPELIAWLRDDVNFT